MKTVCLPEGLWSDPRFVALKKQRPGLWMFVCDLLRFQGLWSAADVASFDAAVYAANLGKLVSRVERWIGELRARGVMEREGFGLVFCRPAAPETEAAPRPRYPSDLRRVSTAGDTGITERVLDSADAPQTLRRGLRTGSTADSADAPQTTPQAAPVTGLTGLPEPVPDSYIKKTGTGLTGQPEPESGGGAGEASGSLVERLVAAGLERWKAELKVADPAYTPERIEEALAAMAFTRQKEAALKARDPKRRDFSPAGYIVNFLLKGWEVPKALVEQREREAQGRLTLLTMQTAPERSDSSAETRRMERRVPQGVPPPREMLAKARAVVQVSPERAAEAEAWVEAQMQAGGGT